MKIETDSTAIEEPKNCESCNAFALYALLADEVQIAEMKTNYATPGYGYGHAKQALFELICEKFKTERARFNELMENTDELDRQLAIGAEKAKAVISGVVAKVKSKTGY
jgi:tryptophanyl-tRNA synthetase